MARDKTQMELSPEQLDILLCVYYWGKQHQEGVLTPDLTTGTILHTLARKRLVADHKVPTSTVSRWKITRRGSRLLIANYPLQTIYRLAGWVEGTQANNKQHSVCYNPVGELRRAMRYILLQIPLEQYPELLSHEVPVMRELATKQYQVLQNEVNNKIN